MSHTNDEQVISDIIRQSGKPRDEILDLINSRMTQYDGLVSYDTVLSIIAQELGVKLGPASAETNDTADTDSSIGELEPGDEAPRITGRIMRLDAVREFTKRDGRVGRVMGVTIADSTGTIRMAIWDEQIRNIQDDAVIGKTIIRITNSQVKAGWKGSGKELQLTPRSRIILNPEDADERAFPGLEENTYNIGELKPDLFNIVVKGTIRRLFEIRTFRKRDGEEGRVGSFILGDQTGETRISLWDQRADDIANLSEGDIVEISGGYSRANKMDPNRIDLSLSARGNLRKIGKDTSFLADRELSKGSGSGTTTLERKISELGQGGDSLKLVGRFRHISETRQITTKDGRNLERRDFIFADTSGALEGIAWEDKCVLLDNVKVGDAVELVGVAVRPPIQGGRLSIKFTQITRIDPVPPTVARSIPPLEKLPNLSQGSGSNNPSGNQRGNLSQDDADFVIPWSTPNRRMKIGSIHKEGFYEIAGTVIDIRSKNIVYPSCPQCLARATLDESGSSDVWICKRHGQIDGPVNRLVFTVILDDGTGSIRVTMIGEAAEKFLGITADQADALIRKVHRPDAPLVSREDMLLGKEVRIRGNIKRDNMNEMSMFCNAVDGVPAADDASFLLEHMN